MNHLEFRSAGRALITDFTGITGMTDLAGILRTVGVGVLASALLAGCGGLSPAEDKSHLVTLTTQLRGANEVPAVVSPGTGQVDAVLNTDTNLLRWRLTYVNLSGPATAGHFHGPAAVGANAGVVLPFPGQLASPAEGFATLTAAQVVDLLAGRWYANIHTAKHPGGEVRGQLTVRR
jgi:hypothetical protein